MTTPAPKPISRVLLSVWMFIMLAVALGSLLPWLALAFSALISYPSQDREFSMYIFLAFFYAYPIFPIGFAIAARNAYKKEENALAWVYSTLSVAPFIIFSLLAYINII